MNIFAGRRLAIAWGKRNEFRSTAKSLPVERNSFRWAAGPLLYPEDVHRCGQESRAQRRVGRYTVL